jgi:hypothetical protein
VAVEGVLVGGEGGVRRRLTGVRSGLDWEAVAALSEHSLEILWTPKMEQLVLRMTLALEQD